ncbi:MAG: hypothetical protein Q8R98_00970 [Rubrivivax sp.]|nr:hypothetical protein [Rubrivivax sp.]MDP3610402.1 hypothetical protein [Rubrivivax sp.]
MKRLKTRLLAAACLLSLNATAQTAGTPADTVNAHTIDARGWAATTRGGQGGRIIRVTTLAASGPGSLREALEAQGPRTVVFEVGGVIDMNGQNLVIKNPFLTVAGQTAPSPGISVIKAETMIAAGEVIVQHVRFRPGEFGRPKKGGGDQDGISTVGGAYNVIVDHCSFSWATDENLSASGPRFTGSTPEQWRAGTSNRITYSHNLLYESLSNSVHEKGEHSKGSLIHDNTSGVLLLRNVYASNRERNALFKGGAQGAMVNNLIFNPGTRAVHYNLHAGEWGDKPYQVGRVALVGNVLRHGPDTLPHVPLFTLRGEGEVDLFLHDNIHTDRSGRAVPPTANLSTTRAQIRVLAQSGLPADVPPMPAATLEAELPKAVGARPWDRDAIDSHVLRELAAGRGRIIDSEVENAVGYPKHAATRRAFDEREWNLLDMSPKAGWGDILRLTRPQD